MIRSSGEGLSSRRTALVDGVVRVIVHDDCHDQKTHTCVSRNNCKECRT